MGTRTTETHCPYCSLQCGVTMTAGDRPPTLVPADFPTNRGGLCSKGWSAPELLDHPERLTRPLRSEEHTSELQSRQYLVCRLLLEKKNYEPTSDLQSIHSLLRLLLL